MSETSDEFEFISKSGLKHRGWTDGSIKKFLGSHDKTAKNPHFSSAAPMLLYSRRRALDIMESDEWQAWYQKSLARRQAQSETQKAIADSKRQALIDKALLELKITIPAHYKTKTQLFKAGIKSWYENKLWHNELRDRSDPLDMPTLPTLKEAPKEHVSRWTSNMLRHEYSNYDAIVWGLSGQIGHTHAYTAVRDAVDGFFENWLNSLPR